MRRTSFHCGENKNHQRVRLNVFAERQSPQEPSKGACLCLNSFKTLGTGNMVSLAGSCGFGGDKPKGAMDLLPQSILYVKGLTRFSSIAFLLLDCVRPIPVELVGVHVH